MDPRSATSTITFPNHPDRCEPTTVRNKHGE
jgi:hypothetical protein